MHRTLRHGAAFQLRPGGPAAGTTGATANRTGLPDRLKSGIEALSGISLDDVKVHHDSDKPAQLDALAYAQGSDIHLAPGQERHLPHEAWHIVQQKQGRVKPTVQMKDGIPVNLDQGLEREADAMGAKAIAMPALLAGGSPMPAAATPTGAAHSDKILQAKWKESDGQWHWDKRVDGVGWHTDGAYYWFQIVDARGSKYAAFVGQKHTHDEWKQLGAKEIAEEIEPLDERKEGVPKSKAIKSGLKLGKDENFVCDPWARKFHLMLRDDHINFVAVKLQIKRKTFKEGFAHNAAITFKDQDIGKDTHYFTIVRVDNKDLAFDNLNPAGIDVGEHLASLKFFGSDEVDSLPYEVPLGAVTRKELKNKSFELGM